MNVAWRRWHYSSIINSLQWLQLGFNLLNRPADGRAGVREFNKFNNLKIIMHKAQMSDLRVTSPRHHASSSTHGGISLPRCHVPHPY